jgi:hypothetical protein
MSKGDTFQAPSAAQSQNTPGLEKNMQPASEATKLETPSGIDEYRGSGKLAGKKALITGGEYVHLPFDSRINGSIGMRS